MVGWNLFAKEFGVIYGFDDEQQMLYAIDNHKDSTIPYDQLPNRRILCLALIEQSLDTNRTDMLKKALAVIIEHAHGRDPLLWNNVHAGLDAYDIWIEAIKSGGSYEIKGNAINVRAISDARRHGVAFLELLSRQWNDGTSKGAQVARLAEEAASHYALSADNLGELEQMYPYPLSKKSANPRATENIPHTVELLGRAKEAEVQGIAVLERMYELLA